VQVWVINVLVINVGVVEMVDCGDIIGNLGEGKVVLVIFAVLIKDVLRIVYVESFVVKVCLVLCGGGDESTVFLGD